MMTNSTPWTAIVHANQQVNVNTTGNNLAVEKRELKSSGKQNGYLPKTFKSARRYSIDDNGGGYKGL